MERAALGAGFQARIVEAVAGPAKAVRETGSAAAGWEEMATEERGLAAEGLKVDLMAERCLAEPGSVATVLGERGSGAKVMVGLGLEAMGWAAWAREEVVWVETGSEVQVTAAQGSAAVDWSKLAREGAGLSLVMAGSKETGSVGRARAEQRLAAQGWGVKTKAVVDREAAWLATREASPVAPNGWAAAG